MLKLVFKGHAEKLGPEPDRSRTIRKLVQKHLPRGSSTATVYVSDSVRIVTSNGTLVSDLEFKNVCRSYGITRNPLPGRSKTGHKLPSGHGVPWWDRDHK